MSYIVATGKAICNCPLNHSKSKAMYSFGKAERFPSQKSISSQAGYYLLPEAKDKRSTSLGKGNRSDFTSGGGGNPNAFYGNYSDFNSAHPHGPRYSFGVGRDKVQKVYCEGNIYYDKDIPGPAKYSYLKPFGAESAKYSIKERHNIKSEADKTPGPGSYNDEVFNNKNGKFQNSKFENIHSIKFGKNNRFKYNYNDTPGPAKYEQKQLMGKVFESRFMSYPAKSISAKWKNVDSRANYPGPGQYVMPSEFGIYETMKLHSNKSAADIKQ